MSNKDLVKNISEMLPERMQRDLALLMIIVWIQYLVSYVNVTKLTLKRQKVDFQGIKPKEG